MRGMIIIQFNDFAYLAEGEHYMNEKQYLRANKRVFLAVTIIFAYITLTMLAALAASHGGSLCPDYDPVSGFGRCDYHFRIGLSDPKENAHLCHHPDNRHDGRLCSCCFY